MYNKSQKGLAPSPVCAFYQYLLLMLKFVIRVSACLYACLCLFVRLPICLCAYMFVNVLEDSLKFHHQFIFNVMDVTMHMFVI